jgi:hypothetical protein
LNENMLCAAVLAASLVTAMPVHAEGCKIQAFFDQSFAEVAGTLPDPTYGMVGIRLPIQASLAALNLSCDWVGDNSIGFDLSATDGFTFDPNFEGGGRATAYDFGATIGLKMEEYKPNIVLIGLGAYDFDLMVQNGPGMSPQSPSGAAANVIHLVDVAHETDPTAKIVLLVPNTGINHHKPYEDLRLSILSLMITRTFADVVDVGRLVRAPDHYVALEFLSEFGQDIVAARVVELIESTARASNIPAPVPVPSAAWLLGLALVAAVMMRRCTSA